MGKKPEIAVVIPLYNKENYIERAVGSVLAQTYPNFELIIVNDGSTDQSLTILERISDNRLRVISQKNRGASAARNHGIQNAEAELVAFLDADDEWQPDMIETLLRLQREFPEAGAYTTSYQMTLNGVTKTRNLTGIPEPPWEGIIPSYLYVLFNSENQPNNSSSTAIPRRVFKEVGFFPEGEKQGEDMDMFFRVAVAYPFALSTKICSTYYRDTENSNSKAWQEKSSYTENIRKAVKEGKIPEDLIEDALEYAAINDLNSAYTHLRQGERSLARKMLLSCKTQRFRRKKWHIYVMTYDHIRLIRWGLSVVQYLWNLRRNTHSRPIESKG